MNTSSQPGAVDRTRPGRRCAIWVLACIAWFPARRTTIPSSIGCEQVAPDASRQHTGVQPSFAKHLRGQGVSAGRTSRHRRGALDRRARADDCPAAVVLPVPDVLLTPGSNRRIRPVGARMFCPVRRADRGPRRRSPDMKNPCRGLTAWPNAGRSRTGGASRTASRPRSAKRLPTWRERGRLCCRPGLSGDGGHHQQALRFITELR